MAEPIVVVGSVAFDSVETPFGRKENVLGGAANYFSIGASFFTRVKIVAVVGEDFPNSHMEYLKSRGVDTAGVTKAKGQTFHWKGRYGFDLNTAETLETHLNVFQNFQPKIPDSYRASKYLFLANIDPELQLKVLDQMVGNPIVGMDTMNWWLTSKREKVLDVLKRVDMLIINDAEARQLANTPWLLTAAKKIQAMGPKVLIVKKGEHGALLFLRDGSVFSAPALPLEEVRDPTGAGDTFASGCFGYMAEKEATIDNHAVLKQAVIYGSVVASFTVEDFSFDRLKTLTRREIDNRVDVFRRLTSF